jgi:hypothetical protein
MGYSNHRIVKVPSTGHLAYPRRRSQTCGTALAFNLNPGNGELHEFNVGQRPIAAFVDDGLRFATRRSHSRIFWRPQSAITPTAAGDAKMTLPGRE